MLTWLQTALETVDQQLETSGSDRTKDLGNDDDISLSSLELSALRSNVRRSTATIASLEEKLSGLEQSKAHYESELRQSESRNVQLTEANQQLELELGRLKTALRNSERKYAQESANFEKTRVALEEQRERMQKEISALSEQLSSTQHELGVASNDLEKVRSDYASQQEDVRKLEDEIAQYRDRVVRDLKIDAHDRTALAQLEVLESERNRLKDSLAKCQQRISQLDAAAREHDEQIHREILDAKQQQGSLENDLVRSRTQIEAMSHEIALLRGELSTSHEAIESRYKAQIAAERNSHAAEIARLKAQLANGTKTGHSSDEQLLNALAMIDSLRSEKAALLVRLQSQRSGGESGLLMNVNLDPHPRRRKSTAVLQFEALFRRFLNFLSLHPLLRIALILWIIILHMHFIARLVA
jgi:chromosome segregation ATPase